MALVEDGNPISESQRNRAIGLLFDSTYHKAKYAIMKPLDEFLKLVDRGTTQKVQTSEDYARTVKFLLFFLCIALVFAARHVHVTLKQLHNAAQQSNRQKSDFISNMSHEIRTPMNAIVGLNELLLETELSPAQRKYLEKIKIATNSLLKILNDILDISKIEAGKIELENVEFDPSQIVNDVVDLFSLQAAEKSILLNVETNPDVPSTVLADQLRFKQIISNLLGNAIKFTNAGTISIKIEVENPLFNKLDLRVSITDTGIGIKDEDLDKLFRAFSQTYSTITRKFGGTGLGLAISQRLVEKMGGKIRVQSQFAKGTTFSFYIPCQLGKAYDWATDPYQLQKLRTLIVANELIANDLSKILNTWGITHQSIVRSLEELPLEPSDIPKDKTYDLILWYYDKPNFSPLQKLRMLQKNRGTTIIALSPMNPFELKSFVQHQGLNIDTFLPLPVKADPLLSSIQRHFHKIKMAPDQSNQKLQRERRLNAIKGAQILVVEDNELNQEVATAFLHKAGMTVTKASDGQAAIELVDKNHFDLILMDIQMPLMDGYQATQYIRNKLNKKKLPIIAMTAAALQHDRDLCIKAGMNDHLAKPIKPDLLIDILIKWISAPPAVSFNLADPGLEP